MPNYQLAAIHDAAASGDVALVRQLLERDPSLVFGKDTQSRMALHFAAAAGHKSMVEFLLSKKAEINAKNSDGLTALALAKEYGCKEVVELLRQHGGRD